MRVFCLIRISPVVVNVELELVEIVLPVMRVDTNNRIVRFFWPHCQYVYSTLNHAFDLLYGGRLRLRFT